MTQTFLITQLLVAVIVGNILTRHFTKVPLPFWLIGLGVVFALFPAYHNYQFNPAVFSFALISPLLYDEAQNASRSWIGRSLTNILSLAVGLVITTILVVGYGVYWLFPLLPLSLAFALVAIVTPTDASAVSAISGHSDSLPMQMLSSESLFNDAAGIVAFNLAIGAYISGEFSANLAIMDFLQEFFGGLILGALFGLFIMWTSTALIRWHDDTPLIMVTMQLLTPFVVYYLATKVGASGILAVVAAGLVQGENRDRLRLTSSHMQLVNANVWEIINGILSGMVFVLLGLSLPVVIRQIWGNSWRMLFLLFGMGVFIYVSRVAIRLLWSHFFLRFEDHSVPSWKESWVIALGGASGTITLALAFSMPVYVSHHLFALRDVLIFVAAVVILLSLIAPTLAFPHLVAKPASPDEDNANLWKRRMLDAAISSVRKQRVDHPAEAQIVIDALVQQLTLNQVPKHRQHRIVLGEAGDAEREVIHQLVQDGKVTPAEEKYYNQFLALNEASSKRNLVHDLWMRVRFSIHMGFISKDFRTAQNTFLTSPLVMEEIYWRRAFDNHGEDIRPLENAGYAAAMQRLHDIENSENQAEVNLTRRGLRNRHRRMQQPEPDQRVIYQLFMSAFHAEYELIQQAVSDGDISMGLSEDLQQQITFDEISYIRNSAVYMK
ncbi:cation:proton antiporter [Levilactobacillus bambusae]|uniref:Sodium:proton antiporter n=1 Tax=Levilactobacillus bambusae TaxID=2024736 RepID=A0A2V1N0B1_9LACO|nr:sodium:proton antiporter [Levilactobacillus bambusae]PWF99864.1 sodium:proton antiporter [Levilactobacillus bambusae]